MKVGILGFGGLGQAAAVVLQGKQELTWVAVADRHGYAYDPQGLNLQQTIAAYQSSGSVGSLGVSSEQSIGDLVAAADGVEGFFLALPNLPNTFFVEVARVFLAAGWRGVLVDALKRTSAMELMFGLDRELADAGITYLTGCGATPGLLTAAAAIASQSFAEVHRVEITFGVGIANWQAYRATIREDIAHLAGYDVARAQGMTDAEVEALLEQTGGILTLERMEHADDVMLERLGICDRHQVTVGGVVDTRHAQKPLSTHMKLTGRTFEGKISSHTFTLGDETSMAANVCGPAFGYLKAGKRLYDRGIHGVLTAAEVMPLFVR
jgi:hypothetical protein